MAYCQYLPLCSRQTHSLAEQELAFESIQTEQSSAIIQGADDSMVTPGEAELTYEPEQPGSNPPLTLTG